MIGNKSEVERFIRDAPEDKLFEIKPYLYAKTLSQNSYCWKLIGMIADTIRQSKEDVYEDMLINYGQSEIVSVLSDKDISLFFKYYKVLGKGVVNGKEFTHYRVCRGISEYDVKEMGIFIDGLINECKNLGIQTMPPDKIKELELY